MLQLLTILAPVPSIALRTVTEEGIDGILTHSAIFTCALCTFYAICNTNAYNIITQIHGIATQIHDIATQTHDIATQVHDIATQIHDIATQIHTNATQIHHQYSKHMTMQHT